MELEEQPPIGEAVNLLGRLAPEVLVRFSHEFPADMKPFLIPGGSAGSVEGDNEKDQLDYQIKLIREANKQGIGFATDRESKVVSIWRRSRRQQVVGEVAALLGSSTVLAAVANDTGLLVYLTGGIALLGSIAALMSRLTAGDDIHSGSLLNYIFDLRTAKRRVEQVERKLELLAPFTKSMTATKRRAILKLCDEANLAFEELIRIIDSREA